MRIQNQDILALQMQLQSSATRHAPDSSDGNTETSSLFASMVANTPPQTPSTTPATDAPPINPLAGWVTCYQTPSATADTTASTAAAVTTSTPAANTTTTSGATSTTDASQPGIGALVTAIMNGSFQPTYLTPSQLVENTPVGTIVNSPAYYASDQTAEQLATLLGGKVVQQVPFASSNADTTEIKANFIELPSGQTVNAADLSYYAQFGAYGDQQLTADLTQEINQGGAISSYNDQMVSYLSGAGTAPTSQPMFQAYEIGAPIAGTTYPSGATGADGMVINPTNPTTIAT